MRVLLTGSAGFIGFHVARALLERGDEVIGYDNFNPYYDPQLKERRNAILEEQSNFRLVRADIGDREALRDAFDDLVRGASGTETRVCHLAAQAGVRHSIDHPDQFVRDNVQAFTYVLELCRKREVGGLIYASSSSVYGDSTRERLSESDSTSAQCSLYGATKKMNELMASVYNHLYGLRVTGLRFFTVYGPWGRPDMALFLFTGALLRGETIKVFGHGRMHRDFTYVDDIAAGVVSAIDRNHEQLVCNLAAGRTEELMAFIRQIESSCGREGEKEFLPMQPGDVVRTAADLTTARESLGYEPTTTIEVGIPRFVDWYRGYYGL